MESRADRSSQEYIQNQSLLKDLTINLKQSFNLIKKSKRSSKHSFKGEVIDDRFIVIKLLGRGSFGKVLKAQNRQTGEVVAIKIIEKSSKSQRHANQEIKTLTEIDKYESNNGYVVKMLEHFEWRGFICIVFEQLHKTLYQLIKETNFKGINLANIKVFAWQILMALKFLAVPELNLIHCDLKPENIMLVSEQKAGVKLIDFGSSCKRSTKYRYVQSRFYRAPEVLMQVNYFSNLDVWSAGCIFCELLTGKPLFPGENDVEQLELIYSIVGKSRHESRLREYFEGYCDEKNFDSFFDLVRKMLNVDPVFRISAEEALNHSFFREVKNKECKSPVYQSTASSIENSPSSKFSSCLLSDFFSIPPCKTHLQFSPNLPQANLQSLPIPNSQPQNPQTRSKYFPSPKIFK